MGGCFTLILMALVSAWYAIDQGNGAAASSGSLGWGFVWGLICFVGMMILLNIIYAIIAWLKSKADSWGEY